jgi:hypothetical protein
MSSYFQKSSDICKQKHYTRQYESGCVLFVSCMSLPTVQCAILLTGCACCMPVTLSIPLVTIPSTYACAYHDYLLLLSVLLSSLPLSHPFCRDCIILCYCCPVNLFIFLSHLQRSTPHFWYNVQLMYLNEKTQKHSILDPACCLCI